MGQIGGAQRALYAAPARVQRRQTEGRAEIRVHKAKIHLDGVDIIPAAAARGQMGHRLPRRQCLVDPSVQVEQAKAARHQRAVLVRGDAEHAGRVAGCVSDLFHAALRVTEIALQRAVLPDGEGQHVIFIQKLGKLYVRGTLREGIPGAVQGQQALRLRRIFLGTLLHAIKVQLFRIRPVDSQESDAVAHGEQLRYRGADKLLRHRDSLLRQKLSSRRKIPKHQLTVLPARDRGHLADADADALPVAGVGDVVQGIPALNHRFFRQERDDTDGNQEHYEENASASPDVHFEPPRLMPRRMIRPSRIKPRLTMPSFSNASRSSRMACIASRQRP